MRNLIDLLLVVLLLLCVYGVINPYDAAQILRQIGRALSPLLAALPALPL